MTKLTSPFQVGGPVVEPYFIGREQTLALLVGDIKGLGQNWLIVAPRRFGKSSLLHNVRLRLRDTPVLLAPSINCLRATGAETLSQLVAEALIVEYERVAAASGLLERFRENWGRGLLSALRAIESISVALAELAEIQIKLREHEVDPDKAVAEALALPGRFAAERGVKVALFLDEFQELAATHGRIFHLLKAEMDAGSDVRYVFSGSSLSLMADVFLKDNAPLYMTTSRLELDVLEQDEAIRFVGERMVDAGMPITQAARSAICDLTGCVPYYLQKLGQMAYQHARVAALPGVTAEHVDEVFARMLSELESEFELRWNSRFSPQQREVLAAIARGAVRPADVARSLRTDPPRISSSLRRLQEAMIVRNVERRLRITDPVFERWILGA